MPRPEGAAAASTSSSSGQVTRRGPQSAFGRVKLVDSQQDEQPVNYSTLPAYTIVQSNQPSSQESPFKQIVRGRLPQYSTNQLVQAQSQFVAQPHGPMVGHGGQSLQQQQPSLVQQSAIDHVNNWTAAEWLLHHNW